MKLWPCVIRGVIEIEYDLWYDIHFFIFQTASTFKIAFSFDFLFNFQSAKMLKIKIKVKNLGSL